MGTQQEMGMLGGPEAVTTSKSKEEKKEEVVVPLESYQVEEIAVYLEASGGALPLGRVCQNFKGLKRAQLEAYFELSQVGTHGQWEVRLPGMESQGAEMIYQGKALPLDAPLPPLTPEQVSAVRSMLQASPGGSMPYMQVIKHVPGIKRKQLEEHFQVLQIDKKRFDISINGLPGRVDTRQKQGAVPADAPRMALAQLAPNGGAMLTMVPQQPAAQATQEPPPPLDAETIQQVTALLEAQGGETWMGKVSQSFKFIKRAQLEEHFEFQKVGDQWLIRLPGVTSNVPPGATDPVAVKQMLASGGSSPQGLAAPRPAARPRTPLKAPAPRSSIVAWRGQGYAPQPARPQLQMGFGMGKGGYMPRPAHGMPLMPQPRMPSFAMKGGGKGKDRAEPLGPLPAEVVVGIEALVDEVGESVGVTLGRISQAFTGVKRAQLEQHFSMWREGDQWKVTKRQRVA